MDRNLHSSHGEHDSRIKATGEGVTYQMARQVHVAAFFLGLPNPY
jgi:hypothetical protein